MRYSVWYARHLRRLLPAALAIAVLAGGCTPPARKPAPGTPAKSTKPGDTTGTAGAKTGANNPGDEVARVLGNDARYRRSGPINAIVFGNVAIAGLGKPGTTPPAGPATPGVTTTPPPAPPPGTTARPGAPGTVTPPTATMPPTAVPRAYTPRPGSVRRVEARLEAEARKRVPELVRIYATTDPTLVTRIAAIARDMRNRVPVERRINEVAMIFNAITGGTAAAPSAPAAPGGTTPR